MSKKQLFLLIALNLFIAIGFFLENNGAGFTQFSSDLHNSIPVCYKLDDPTLFKGDLYLNDTENVKYYTPFFIEAIRFFARVANGDYLIGINIFATFLHLIFGLSWFAIFYKVLRHFGVALLISILARGIVWLPGFEIWGISDIWTMMPRTMYAAFLPLPFLLLFNQTRISFLGACLLSGLIFNFHPISGIGGILLFALFIGFSALLFKVRIPLRDLVAGAGLMLLGMLPFLLTYFSKTDSSAAYDVAEFRRAFFHRIPEFFVQPAAFLRQWLKPGLLFFGLPMLAFFGYAWFFEKRHLKKATVILLVPVCLILICSVSIFVEDAINSAAGLNLRMGFQVIRAQKLAILPAYFAIGFLILAMLERSTLFTRLFRFGVPALIILLIFAKQPVLSKLPFLGDDIANSIFPDYRLIFAPAEAKRSQLDRMLSFISENSGKNDIFWGRNFVRSACRRSVVLDTKGASMLIEGNPQELITWYRESVHVESLPDSEKIIYLREKKGVTHILASEPINAELELLHAEGQYKFYRIPK